jgi:aspartate kinase
MLIVQKYGGATLSDPLKIKNVALRISQLAKAGHQIIVVVSAMGKTTNTLIDLAQQVSQSPQRRELDMLLSVGERISMSLMSIALNDINCPAISFTGSQAGILTNDSHLNALITDVKATRVAEALNNNKVVILAGFQGVSPLTKEITTLGRGGSDTTAVAMAAAFKAERCEILKDVPAIFSADPKIVKDARSIETLSYEALLDMTFWGAKVLHYRSVELAMQRGVTLYIGPAADSGALGTLLSPKSKNLSENKINDQKESFMFESTRPVSINSHENVIQVLCKNKNSSDCLNSFLKFLETHQIASPQILEMTTLNKDTRLLLTGPSEVVESLVLAISKSQEFILESQSLCSITMTCLGASSPELPQMILKTLQDHQIQTHQLILGGMSVTALMNRSDRDKAILKLHDLIK